MMSAPVSSVRGAACWATPAAMARATSGSIRCVALRLLNQRLPNASSSIAALMAAALGSGCGYCETFEGPRVGDLAFCKWMDSRVPNFYRDVIIGDVVPHAPPENLGYFHAGIEIDLDPSGVIPLTLDSKVFLESHHVLSSVQLLLEAPA